jgi:two-component system nitrate/nitrite sensor histidine kinase NarX
MITVLLPTAMIGGFEYFRHDVLTNYMSMEAGNFYMTLLTFVLSYLFASWMFRHIEQSNIQLVEEQARRAVYEERERLANELHDNIAQTLFFLNIQLQKGHMEDAKSAVSDINNQVRQAIYNLRISPDEGTAFAERTRLWLQEWSMVTGIDVKMELMLEPAYFTPVEEVHLFGLMQEAFTNIRKHSQASSAALLIQAENRGWQLRITDNGRGVDVLDGQNKYGIAMMKKRAEELNAQFELNNLTDGGTVLHVIRLKGDKV